MAAIKSHTGGFCVISVPADWKNLLAVRSLRHCLLSKPKEVAEAAGSVSNGESTRLPPPHGSVINPPTRRGRRRD